MTEPINQEIVQRLDRIELAIQAISEQKPAQEFYSTSEVAEILGKAEFTVREWCRNHRVWASKRPAGRGKSKEWMISHEELQRIKSEGLLAR